MKKSITVSAFLLIGSLVYLAKYNENSLYLREIFNDLIHYIAGHPAIGSIIYSIGYGMASCLFVPTTFPTLLAGVLFRPLPFAVLVSLAGCQFGIIFSFIIGRIIFRPWIEEKSRSDPKFRAIDSAVGQQGWKVVVLMRLSPIFPFGICNYLLSSTRIPVLMVLGSSILGNFPGAFIYSLLGSFLGSIADAGEYETPVKYQALLGLFAICFAVGTTVFLTILAQSALRSVTDLQPVSSEEEPLIQEDSMVQDETMSSFGDDDNLEDSISQRSEPEGSLF